MVGSRGAGGVFAGAGRSELRAGLSWLRLPVLFVEVASELDLRAHQVKEVRGDHSEANLFRRSVVAKNRPASGQHAAEIFEGVLGRLAQIEILRVRKREILDVALAHIAADDHQLVRILIGKRLQQHGVGDAENRSAGADAEPDGDHCRRQK